MNNKKSKILILIFAILFSFAGLFGFANTEKDVSYAAPPSESTTGEQVTGNTSPVQAATTTTTVTWTQDDIVSDNLVSDYTFSKDGVTLTAELLNLEYKFIAEGTFSTTLGNFTKIEVTGSNGIKGTGWSGDEMGIIWTEEPASSVSFSGAINGYDGVTIVFTIEPAEEQQSQKVITFRPVVVDTREYATTERVYVNQIPEEVVVNYYVTYNDGVNAFVLVPSYDKNVFTLLDSENNPRVAVNGIDASAITVTGNVKDEDDPEFVKIAFDSSTLYDASPESNENVLLLTLTFSVHTNPLQNNYGHFRGFFGLVLDDNGKTNNTSSVAYQDLSGEELGGQEEVYIRLDVDNPDEVAVPENVVDIYHRDTATITAAESVTCTYRKEPMPVTKVGTINPNLEYGVQFQYNGNGEPVITWTDSNDQPLTSAPQNAGTYKVTISVPATDTFNAPEPKTITVTINPAQVVVNITNQTKVYGEDPISFAGNFGVGVPSGLYTVSGSVCQGDTITFNLTSAVTASSNAGEYAISKTNVNISDGNNGNNYGLTINNGTYTVSKYIIKVYYGFEQTTFNGGTKTAYSLTGTPNITNNNYEALEEDISELLGTVNVTYSIALPEGVVPANNPEYEEDCYTVTPLYAFVKEGSANNFEVITTQSYYKINPAAVTLKAGNASAEFNGGTKADYAAPTEYYVYAGSTTTPVSEALRTALGTVTLTVNFPEGVVNAGNYTITPSYTNNSNFVVTTSNGTYTINTKDLTDAEKASIYAAFGIVEVTYDAQGHQMYTFDGSSLPLGLTASDLGTRYSYLAKINDETASDRISAGTYPVTITFTINDATINQNRNSTYGKEGYQPISLTFVVKEVENDVTKYSSISQKAVTITAENKEHTWGNTPQTLTPATAGINGEVNVTFTVQDANKQAVTLSQTTPVGTYTIVPSATNDNYAFTFENGTYEVLKATPTLTIVARESMNYCDTWYLYQIKIQVGNLVYDSYNSESGYGFNFAIEILNPNGTKVYTNPTIGEQYWWDSSALFTNVEDQHYLAKLVLTGTDNYNSAEATDEFIIERVQLAAPTGVTYNKGSVTWNEVTTDACPFDPHALKTGTTVTYSVNGNDCGTTRQYNAVAAGAHTLTATSSNLNYTSNTINLSNVYSVSYTDGEHNLTQVDLTMPATQYLFDGEDVGSAPEFTQTVTGYTFDGWYLGQEKYNFSTPVYANKELVAKWNIVTYTVTFKYTETAQTANTDVFTAQVAYKSTVDYQALSLQPTKTSENVGIYYTFNNTWKLGEDVLTNAEVDDYVVTSALTFVAQYDTKYNKFTVTYHVKENGGNYVEQEYKTEVAYGSEISYVALSTNVQWFTAKAWFANEDRTEAAPTTMPNHNIDVYGAVVFNVGLGDVNGDGYVNANDITLYRQWIVGGYEMTVVAANTEWETATASNFEPNGKYYLVRVADNNADTSKDIRDVSITRMAVVGGYTWGIRTGLNVTGQEIRRDGRANSLSSLSESLQAGERVTLIDNITDSNALNLIELDKNIYINLNGKTLTVSQLTLNVNGDRTITIENGTIVTTNGVTLTAPNGSVVLTSVTAYDKYGVIQLQAANQSLHFNGVVNFYQGVDTTVQNPTPAVVKVEKGTHIVVEKASNVVVEKLVVTEQFVPTEAADAKISIENNSLVYTPVTVVGNVDVDNDVEIDTFEELVAAGKKGGEFTLNADIDVKGYVLFTKNATLNLNGHTIYNSTDIWGGEIWSLVSVGAEKLTINGEGSLLAKENDCYAVDVWGGAELVINGGNYAGNCHAVYVYEGSLTVNGGYFYVQQVMDKNPAAPYGYVLNCLDANYQNGTATIVVKGGSYEGFNPADCAAESPRGHFVPAEYYVVEAENVYTVLPKAYVTTEAELKTAVESDNYVVLNADIDLTAQVNVTKNVTLDLNGHKLYNTVVIWNNSENVKTWSLISVQAGKLTINGEGSLLANANDCFAVDVRNGAELVINGGNYAGNISAVYVIEGALTVNGGYFYVQQSDFNSEVGQEKFVLNCFDANYKNGTATIVVNGGSFKLFNPGDCVAEGNHTNFLSEGHTVTSQVVGENTVYTVA